MLAALVVDAKLCRFHYINIVAAVVAAPLLRLGLQFCYAPTLFTILLISPCFNP